MAERNYLDQTGLDTLVEQILIKLSEKLSLTGGHVTGDTIIDVLQSSDLSITSTATYIEEPDYDSNPMLLTTRQKVDNMLYDLDLNTIKITDGTTITVVQPSDLENLKNSIEPILCQELPIPDSTNHGRLALLYDGKADSVYVSILTDTGYQWKDLSSSGGSTVTVTPARTSGTSVGDITVDGTKKTLYIPSTYLDKSSTARQEISGQVYVGSCSTNLGNAYTHQRNVSSFGSSVVTGTPYVGACFAVSSDGSASFQHKTFTSETGGGARNAAVLRFYGTQDKRGKIQFAINTGSSATPTEDMYKDVAMVDDIPKFVTLTQEEYDRIPNPDADTYYVIVE